MNEHNIRESMDAFVESSERTPVVNEGQDEDFVDLDQPQEVGFFPSIHQQQATQAQQNYPVEGRPTISELAERRRMQNRIAQRNYRRKLKKKFEDFERRAASSSAPVNPADQGDYSRRSPDIPAEELGYAGVGERVHEDDDHLQRSQGRRRIIPDDDDGARALDDDAPYKPPSIERSYPDFTEYDLRSHDNLGTSLRPGYHADPMELNEEQVREEEELLAQKRLELKVLKEKTAREEDEEALLRKRLDLGILKDKQERDEEEERLKREEEHIRKKYERKRPEEEERILEKYERKRLEDKRRRQKEEEELEELRKRAVQAEKERIAKEAAAKKTAAEEYGLKIESEAKEAED
ncbi:Basic-leucine zipper transcription factor [Lasiodiplodia theobromae]|uniref:Basic-leucine zipper transcription factor n=1 Tax=Lasiodiplodia theobromae TaxID=45133 RepID=UPI0015C3981D|nr:Basic-leucine zipper transcription factor [Lasiodiplodia theobromae]KAF4536782.1 Basic-leucine zipper transcription factor [Lasiodiplodia theobromae]